MTKDEAIEKIRKLRGLAERAGTDGEAQAALTQAMSIATRYQVSETDLVIEEQLFTVVYESRRIAGYIEVAFSNIAQLCGCFPARNGQRLVLAGRPQDKEVAKILILATLDTMEAAFHRTPKGTRKAPFCVGFLRVLLQRMMEAQNDVLDSLRSQALVVIAPQDRAIEAEAEVREEVHVGQPRKHVMKDDPVSRARGAGAAEKVKLPGEHKEIEDG